MESFSEGDLTDNSDEVIESDSYCIPSEEDQKLSRLRDSIDQNRCGNIPSNNNCVHHRNKDGSIICSIIGDDELVAENSRVLLGGRSRGPVIGSEEENLFKFKKVLKAKPWLPEVESLHETTLASDTTSWSACNWNNVVVHQCNKSCVCDSDKANMYSAAAYKSQDSF